MQEEEVPLPLPFTLQRGEEGVKEGAERVKEKLGLEEGVGGLVVVGMPRSKGVEEVGGELEGVFKAGVKCLRLKGIFFFSLFIYLFIVIFVLFFFFQNSLIMIY